MMKRKIPVCLLLTLIFSSTCAIAQNEDDEDEDDANYRRAVRIESWGKPDLFEGRLLLGLNCAQINGDSHAGFHKAGLSAGGAVYVHIKPAFGVSMELLYTQKGVRGANVKESYAWGTYFDKYYLNLNYAEAALLLHLDAVVLDYEAGISYGRLISSREWADSDVPIIFPPDYSYFNNYDLCYLAGLSYRFKKRWRINCRYQHSMLTVRPAERVMPRYGDGKNQFNEMFSFRLAYTL